MNIHEEAWKLLERYHGNTPIMAGSGFVDLKRLMAVYLKQARKTYKAYQKKMEKELEAGYKELAEEHDRRLKEIDEGKNLND